VTIDPNSDPSSKASKLLSFEVLRAVCALIVLLHHGLILFAVPAIPAWLLAIAHTSTEAVILFFLLSGTVITHSLRRRARSAGAFILDRLVRIYPVYVLAILAAALSSSVSVGPSQPLSIWLANLVFLQSWTGAPFALLDHNRALWSLPYEMFYYALVALMLAVGRRALLLIAALLLVVWLARANPSAHYLLLMLGLAPAFFVGSALVHFAPRLPRVPLAMGALSAIVTLILARWFEGSIAELWRQNLYAAGSSPLLLALYQQRHQQLPKWLTPLAFLGSISYALYAFHHPLFLLTRNALNTSWPLELTSGVALTVAAAVLAERLLQPRLKKLWRRSPPRQHAKPLQAPESPVRMTDG